MSLPNPDLRAGFRGTPAHSIIQHEAGLFDRMCRAGLWETIFTDVAGPIGDL